MAVMFLRNLVQPHELCCSAGSYTTQEVSTLLHSLKRRQVGTERASPCHVTVTAFCKTGAYLTLTFPYEGSRVKSMLPVKERLP